MEKIKFETITDERDEQIIKAIKIALEKEYGISDAIMGLLPVGGNLILQICIKKELSLKEREKIEEVLTLKKNEINKNSKIKLIEVYSVR